MSVTDSLTGTSVHWKNAYMMRLTPKRSTRWYLGVDITPYSQEQITTMMCNINSYSRKTLGNKSPYEVFAFQYGEEALKKLGLRKIPANEIILNPSLFN